MNIREALNAASQELSDVSDTARLDAEVLLADILNKSRTWLIAENQSSLSSEEEKLFRQAVARRKHFEPVAYITNKKEFFGLDFYVDKNVLVPRPETELLAEKVIQYARTFKKEKIVILELGTGSGCLSVAIASELKNAGVAFEVIAADIDDAAISVASRNILKHNLSDVITVCRSNWFSAFPNESKFDIVVSNPPYVPTGQTETSREIEHEPKHAIFAGNDGLESLRVILENVQNYVNNGALLFCEMSYDHRPLIEELVSRIFPGNESLDFFKDLAGLDRFFKVEFYGKEK